MKKYIVQVQPLHAVNAFTSPLTVFADEVEEISRQAITEPFGLEFKTGGEVSAIFYSVSYWKCLGSVK